MPRFLLGLGLFALATAPAAGQFPLTAPTVVVVRVGSDTSVTVRSFNTTTASFGTDFTFQTTGASALTIGMTTVSDGALSVSPNGRYFGLTGYRTGTNAGTT